MSISRKSSEVPDSAGNGTDWGNLEERDYEARLVFIADLGMQRKEYKGEFNGNYTQACLGLEIIGEGMEDDDGVMMPRVLFTKPFYLYSTMDEKSTEYEFYKMFDPKAVPDSVPKWEDQMGKPISVAVVNVQGKGENASHTYDNITGLSRIPEKYQGSVGEAVSDFGNGIGDCDDDKNMVTAQLRGLPKFIFEKRIVAGGSVATETIVESDQVDIDDDIQF